MTIADGQPLDEYDRTLIVIRERSFLDLLDLALLVIRQRPLWLALAAVAGIAPWAALNLWLLSDPEFPRYFWVMLLILETPWATAPLTLVLGDLMFEQRPRPGRMFQTLLVSLPAMITIQVVVHGLLLATVVGYLAMPAQYSFLNEIILLERREWWRIAGAIASALERCRGRALHPLAGTALSGHDLRALLLGLYANPEQGPGQRRAHLVSSGPLRSERRLVSGGRLDRHRLLRGIPVLRVHRSADPARGLGARPAPDGRQSRTPGAIDVTPLPAFANLVLWAGTCWPPEDRLTNRHREQECRRPVRPREPAILGRPIVHRRRRRSGVETTPGTMRRPIASARSMPFSDFGAMIDPPTEDVTAHVLEMLAALGLGRRSVRGARLRVSA